MKKILTAIVIATTCANANAMSSIRNNATRVYNNGYQIGYHAGKQHAYNKVARTVAIVGVAVVASVFIYQLGKESRWGTNENGITYKF